VNIIKCEANENVLLMSDLHIGRPDVDYGMIKTELYGTSNHDIHINGDIMDCIIPKDSKRFQPSDLHKRLRGRNDVIGAQLDWAVELLSPVAANIKMLGVGNHEDAIEKYHGFNPVRELIKRLNLSPSVYGAYSGIIKYPRYSIHYHHGSGGGSSVASAVGKFVKKLEYTDTDVIWLGHKHHRLFAHLRRVVEKRGKLAYKDCRFIMTGAYMDTYSNEEPSYGEKSDYPPQGKGGVWIRNGSVIF
jgi:hypothetical protein